MEIVADLWHLAFANLVQERAPPSFIVESEVRLTIEPQRADLLLIRRTDAPRDDNAGRVLHAIWPRLAKVTVVEFKSPTKSSFRRGDLIRLFGYGPLYQSAHIDDLPKRADLTLLLVVPSITPTLREEIEAMGWTMSDLGGGYRRIDGAVYDFYVAVTDDVAEAEHDEFLRLFSHQHVADPKVMWWGRHWMKETGMKQKIEDIPGYEEFRDKILEDFTPEERLRGVAPERLILALPDDALRALSDAYLRTLSDETQQAIRKRIGRPN